MASQRATPELREAILEVIGKPIYPFLITTASDGSPYSRPLICINEGFTVRMVTRASSRKVGHLARNPRAALLWLDGKRSVLLRGPVQVLRGEEVVSDFYRRYFIKNPERTRQPPPGVERVVLELRPTFCRADWFAGFIPVVLRQDELLEGGGAG